MLSLSGNHLKVFHSMSFSDVVEAIKALCVEEKQEIQLLLQQYLREERRVTVNKLGTTYILLVKTS